MKIEKIIYEKDEKDNIFNNCTVIYEDGTSEITNDVSGKIMEFMIQEGLTLDTVMKDSRIINAKTKEKKEKHDIIASPAPKAEKVEEDEDIEEDVVTSGSVSTGDTPKKRRLGVRILSIASAVVLGGVAIDYFINRNKSRVYSNNRVTYEQTTTQTTYSTTQTTTTTKAPVVSVSKTNTTTDDGYNDTFRQNVEETIEHIDPLTRNVRSLNNGEKLTEEDILSTINGINRLCQANMAEVEKLIEGGKMSGDKIFPLFDEMFPEGSIERKVLSNFMSRRNILVDNAYNQNRNATISEVNEYNDFFLNFLLGSSTFEHNNKRYSYYDISPIARYIVFMLGQTTIETNHNYSKKINGKNCNFNTIISELEGYFDMVTSQLFQSKKSK